LLGWVPHARAPCRRGALPPTCPQIQTFYEFVRQWKSAEQALRDAVRSDVERNGGVSLPLRVDGAAAQLAAR
jgi:hypothetical protein